MLRLSHSMVAARNSLHTFADTWAHEFFSGRMRGDENDVAMIRVYDREGAEIPAKIENIVYKMMPRVGHGEALFLPDIAYRIWGCERSHINMTLRKDNVDCYAGCAREIYAWLRGLKTTYYLRTTSATYAEKSTVARGALNAVSSAGVSSHGAATEPASDVKFCSIDNPDCEACQ